MERKSSDEDQGRTDRAPSGAAVMRADVTDALSRLFFEEWADHGFKGLSLERVARRAGSGKAALYRRWPDKVAMARALLANVGLTITDVPEQETLEADLEIQLLAIRRVLRHRSIRRILADLHAELGRTPELAAAVRPFQQARRARIDGLIDRAIVRGELSASCDREAAADLVASPIYWRMVVVGGRADGVYVKRLATMLGAALRAC